MFFIGDPTEDEHVDYFVTNDNQQEPTIDP